MRLPFLKLEGGGETRVGPSYAETSGCNVHGLTEERVEEIHPNVASVPPLLDRGPSLGSSLSLLHFRVFGVSQGRTSELTYHFKPSQRGTPLCVMIGIPSAAQIQEEHVEGIDQERVSKVNSRALRITAAKLAEFVGIRASICYIRASGKCYWGRGNPSKGGWGACSR